MKVEDKKLGFEENLAFAEEARSLAKRLFKSAAKQARLSNWLCDTYQKARDKDILIIHNPGGWGTTDLAHLLDWERSVVEGVKATIDGMGYPYALVQYFRGDFAWWAHLLDMKEQARAFFTGKLYAAEAMAAQLRLILKHLEHLRIILVGVSQGAAFGDAVMKQLGEVSRIYSIELGIFFTQVPWRVITERTLAIDSNGLMPDAVVRRDLKAGIKAYTTAPFCWAKYQLVRKPMKFSHCVRVSGHEYYWHYPRVGKEIVGFLTRHFGTRSMEKSK
ncbi:MAG: hypothetical protein HY670_09105 [Chloroflexi bacterium]|nr:hypothetical protein [Chloroflexota bacterium]